MTQRPYLVQVVFDEPLSHQEYVTILDALAGGNLAAVVFNAQTDPLESYALTPPRGFLACYVLAASESEAQAAVHAAVQRRHPISRLRTTEQWLGEPAA